MIRPKVGVSKCLEFEACRYNAVMISNEFVRHLKDYVDFVPVCPEAEIGLGTPRPTVVLQTSGADNLELYQPTTDTVHTEKMIKLADNYISNNTELDGFIFKSKSPSCGLKGVKVYHKKSKQAVKASKGLFALKISEHYDLIAAEEDGRLNDFQIREHFLIKLYSIARFREVEKSNNIKMLQEFHARHKMLFYCYNQNILRKMGRIASNLEKKDIKLVIKEYAENLALIFSKVLSYKKRINSLIHMLGYFKEHITAKQKAHFLESVEDYRNSRISAFAPLAIMQSWTKGYDVPYLENQYIFEPFPKGIRFVTDSGKGVKR